MTSLPSMTGRHIKLGQVAKNFHAAIGHKSAFVQECTLQYILSLIQGAYHADDATFVVVSKRVAESKYSTTVLEETTGKLFRAFHPVGVLRLFKGIAKSSGGSVRVLEDDEEYTKAAAPVDEKLKDEQAYARRWW